jgi:hypothetical protein
MRTGRPIPPVTLPPTEQATLEGWTRPATTVQA